jgi:flagellar basal-body rod modification protein FlgD
MSVRIPDTIPQVQPESIVPVKDPKRKDEELREQFITLFLAQLKNQDPLQPMTDMEMTQQLASFSQLEQLFNLNSNFGAMSNLFTSINTLQASTLLGRTVKATGQTIEVADGKPETIAYTLPESVHSLKVNIEAPTGEVIKETVITANEMKEEGQHDLIWDGTDSEGNPVADGTYTVRFEAKRVDDSAVSVKQYLSGKVSSVSLEDGTVIVRVADKELSLSDIVEIQE